MTINNGDYARENSGWDNTSWCVGSKRLGETFGFWKWLKPTGLEGEAPAGALLYPCFIPGFLLRLWLDLSRAGFSWMFTRTGGKPRDFWVWGLHLCQARHYSGCGTIPRHHPGCGLETSLGFLDGSCHPRGTLGIAESRNGLGWKGHSEVVGRDIFH